MVRIAAVVLVLLAACAPSGAASAETTFLQANLAGGWADGAEVAGADDVARALVALAVAADPQAILLNEACESHAATVAGELGPAWRWFFVRAWDGQSGCFPAPGRREGRFGNAVLVRDSSATPLRVPSCNDVGADHGRCLPNWPLPAEQRRGICARTDARLVCTAHLDPRHWAPHDEQLLALGEIARSLAAEHPVVVVGGDLNDSGEAASAAFGDGFLRLDGGRRQLTYPASAPRRDLDHLLVSGAGVAAGAARTADLGRCAATHRDDGRCTDHLAVVATMVAG